jgi:hypothetical protein
MSLCDTCNVPGACCRSMVLVDEQGGPLLFPVRHDDRMRQADFEAAECPCRSGPCHRRRPCIPKAEDREYSGLFRVLRWGQTADARYTISARTYAGSSKRAAIRLAGQGASILCRIS